MFDTSSNETTWTVASCLLLDWVVLEVQEPASPVGSAKVNASRKYHGQKIRKTRWDRF